jgi:hypothetical protein
MTRASDPHSLPNAEVFIDNYRVCPECSSIALGLMYPTECLNGCKGTINGAGYDETASVGRGYFWWPCFPGCLPDGDPIGPFDTEADAIEDARSHCE